jgi:hypothetical protein
MPPIARALAPRNFLAVMAFKAQEPFRAIPVAVAIPFADLQIRTIRVVAMKFYFLTESLYSGYAGVRHKARLPVFPCNTSPILDVTIFGVSVVPFAFAALKAVVFRVIVICA